jgi:hypothetical protein
MYNPTYVNDLPFNLTIITPGYQTYSQTIPVANYNYFPAGFAWSQRVIVVDSFNEHSTVYLSNANNNAAQGWAISWIVNWDPSSPGVVNPLLIVAPPRAPGNSSSGYFQQFSQLYFEKILETTATYARRLGAPVDYIDAGGVYDIASWRLVPGTPYSYFLTCEGATKYASYIYAHFTKSSGLLHTTCANRTSLEAEARSHNKRMHSLNGNRGGRGRRRGGKSANPGGNPLTAVAQTAKRENPPPPAHAVLDAKAEGEAADAHHNQERDTNAKPPPPKLLPSLRRANSRRLS